MSQDRKIMEAILLLADEPIPASQIGEVLERPRREVEEQLETMARDYLAEERGFVLREVAGGWRFYTSPDCGPWLERFVTGHSYSRLSSASLEVLAIVAYKGPLSRTQISEIRGVESDGVVKTLLQRGLLSEAGRSGGASGPVLFTVSNDLLEHLGLRSLDELPPLTSFMPDAEAVEDMEAKLSPGI
ncbi:MAG: SMC-Scp complex subunit ScpB [Actinomycetota bacterium]